MKDHIIICGLGEIGFQIFTLLQRAGIQTAIISQKTHAEWIWEIEQSGNIYLTGDARDDNVLLEAGIKNAKALLTLTNDDHVNFSIAMDAKKLNPTIKVVSRIYDTDLGNLVSDAFDIEQVFSTSELAAPIFSRNITHTDTHIVGQFVFDKKTYIVHETKKMIQPGEIILEASPESSLIANPVKPIEKKDSFFKTLNLALFRKPVFVFFSRFLIIFSLIVLFSAVYLSHAMPLSITNAIYFVVTTVTSVGYGDINFLQSSTVLKYFGCLLMLTGTAILAVLVSATTEMLILKRLPKVAGGFRVPKKDHVIVIGANRIGNRIINNLVAASLPVVIIEDDNECFPEDISRHTAVVKGSPRSADTLHRTNIKNARAIIAVTPDDIENLSIGLAGKKLNSRIIELMQINNTQIRGNLKKTLDAATLFSVPFISSPYFIAAIFAPKILFAIEWHGKIIYLSNDNEKIKMDSIALNSSFNPN